MEPLFRVTPILRTSQVDPGGEIIVDIYFTGVGEFKQSKLHIIHAYPEIFSDGSEYAIGIGRLVPGIMTEDIDAKNRFGIRENQSNESWRVDSVGSMIHFPQSYFLEIPESDSNERVRSQSFGSGYDPPQYAERFVEMKYGTSPPFKLRLRTADSAPSGDYTITLNFIYGDENTASMDSREVVVHINSKREQLEPWPTRAGILAALVALITLILQAIITLYTI